VYATLNELLRLPKARDDVCKTSSDGWVCRPLDGKSLAPVVLGVLPDTESDTGSTFPPAPTTVIATTAAVKRGLRGKSSDKTLRALSSKKSHSKGKEKESSKDSSQSSKLMTTVPTGPGLIMPKFAHDFAISQVIRCANLRSIPSQLTAPHRHLNHENKPTTPPVPRSAMWNDCETRSHKANEMSLLGYSMRTADYRYTAYYPFNRNLQRPNMTAGLTTVPYEEELFDHKNETLSDFTHREITNLAYRPSYAVVITHMRAKLAEFVIKSFSNVSPHKK
jgi:hypothetical protein